MNTRRWQATLALAVSISVSGNVGYALLTATPAHAVGAALAAAVAPTMLFLITHNLAAERGSAAGDWRHRASLAGAWAITAMAFAASYIELHALMILLGRSPASAVLTPLIVDIAIAVASLRVLATDAPPQHARIRRPSHLRRLADAVTARAEAAMAIPQNPQVGTVAEVHGAESGTVAKPVTESVADATGEAGGASAEGTAEVHEAVRGRSAKTSGKPRGVSAKGSVKHVADPALEPFMEQAQRLAEAGTVRGKAATDYARILWAVGEGWSPTRIKNELRYSQETTRKVVEAASGERPALTVV